MILYPGNVVSAEVLLLPRSQVSLSPLFQRQPEPQEDIVTADGKYTPRNKLNNLTGKLWVQFTKSWYVHAPPPRRGDEVLHPAKFPEDLIQKYVEFFTKRGAWVLDPFGGTGSTQLACEQAGRNAVGIEISAMWANIAGKRTRNYTVVGDSAKIACLNLPAFDFCISSPPYWDMLRHSRGGSDSTHKDRAATGLPLHFSEEAGDIGNIESYGAFMGALTGIYRGILAKMAPGAYCVVFMQNIQKENQQFFPLAWEFALAMRGAGWQLCQEQIWCQRDKKLGIWGYPTSYISNVHHHYALVFRAPTGGARL